MHMQREILQSLRMDGFVVDHKLPEIHLWKAVIIVSLEEYEGWLRRIQDAWLMRGEPVAYEYGASIRRLRFELEHQWFRHICDLAERDHSYVMRKLTELETRYGFHNVRFAPMPPPQLKKDRRQHLSARRKFRRNA